MTQTAWYQVDDGVDDELTMADRLTALQIARQVDPLKGVIGAVRQEIAGGVPAGELRQPDDRVTGLVAEAAQRHIEAYQTRSRASGLAHLQGETEELVQRVVDEILGLGPLQALMDAPGIEDIAINGPREVFVFKNGAWVRSPVVFGSVEELTILVNRAIGHTGRQVSTMAPRVDAQLRDGSRINILHPTIASPGPAVTIRRYSDRVMRMLDLVRAGSGVVYAPLPPAQFTDYFGLGVWDGTITPQAATFLEMCVLARANMVVVGGTGAGKTTLLNALTELIPRQERIVTIEDTRELRVRHENRHPASRDYNPVSRDHTALRPTCPGEQCQGALGDPISGDAGSAAATAPHLPCTAVPWSAIDAGEREDGPGSTGNNVVNLTVRYETVEGTRGVGQQDLLQSALRMRPDRLIVGEVRGAEALDLLMAHNTGHDGGMTTLHANSLAEVPKRLAQMIQLNDLSIKIDRRTVAEWVAGAFQIGVFIHRDPTTNHRAVTQIIEFTGQVEGDAVLTQPLFDSQDGALRRTPFRMRQEHLLARIGHSYDSVMKMDKLAPWSTAFA